MVGSAPVTPLTSGPIGAGKRGRPALEGVLARTHVALATHEVGTVPVHVLRDFLVPRVPGLLFVHHPLQYQRMAARRRSQARTYGDLVGTRLLPPPPPFSAESASYVKDALLTVAWTLQCRRRFGLFVGAGNLNAFCGLLLRGAGVVRRAVYYAIDYDPERFRQPMLAGVHRTAERLCVERCDATWSVSAVMPEARRRAGIRTTRPQLLAPIGVHARPGRAAGDWKDSPSFERRRVVFMGNLLESHGLQLVVRALPDVLAHVPDARLAIYGDGPYRGALERLVRSLGLDGAVTFHGYVESHRALDEALARGGVAVATYSPEHATFTRYADPGKLKSYLAAGLPVVMTGVPPGAARLDGHCAQVIPYDESACAAALVRLLRDDAAYGALRAAALALAEDFDWSDIFTRVLAETLDA
jgi:glycosyltransferase involved in cell wall biosynthesis